MISLEKMSDIIWTEKVMFRICIYTYMYLWNNNKKSPWIWKVVKRYMGGFRSRKGKGKMIQLYYIITISERKEKENWKPILIGLRGIANHTKGQAGAAGAVLWYSALWGLHLWAAFLSLLWWGLVCSNYQFSKHALCFSKQENGIPLW